MTENSVNLLRLSQDNLYFPMPLSNLIENVIQLKSLLQPTGVREENVLAFKVLSSVRSRYGVRPQTGFIFASANAKITFFLDVQQMKEKIRRGFTTMPGIGTDDVIFIDVAVVPASVVAGCLSKNAPDTGGGNEKNAYVEEAAEFWKSRGRVQDAEKGARRYQLRSLYYESQDGVPEGLVVRKGKPRASLNATTPRSDGATPLRANSADAAPAVPTTRPATDSADGHRTAPPLAPPRRVPSTATTPRAAPAVPGPAAAPQGASAVAAKGPLGCPARGEFVAMHGVCDVAFWKELVFIKVPIPVVGALLLLSILCALFERGTILSMLLIGQ